MLLLAALAFLAGACGTDDDVTDDNRNNGTGTEQPAYEYLTPGTDARPDWATPDYSLYGGITMAVQVQLGDTLAYFQSSADLMCAKISGDVRAVTKPMTTNGIVYYPLSIAGDGTNVAVSLHYYCDQLHRIFSIENWAVFDPSTKPSGDSRMYWPCFTANY